MLLCTVVALASCKKDDTNTDPNAITYTLSANGSETEATTVITIKFSKEVPINTDNITLTAGDTGAVKVKVVAKSKVEHELTVSGITKSGEVTITPKREGYVFSPESKKVAVKAGK